MNSEVRDAADAWASETPLLTRAQLRNGLACIGSARHGRAVELPMYAWTELIGGRSTGTFFVCDGCLALIPMEARANSAKDGDIAIYSEQGSSGAVHLLFFIDGSAARAAWPMIADWPLPW